MKIKELKKLLEPFDENLEVDCEYQNAMNRQEVITSINIDKVIGFYDLKKDKTSKVVILIS
jgi:hypothetical protein